MAIPLEWAITGIRKARLEAGFFLTVGFGASIGRAGQNRVHWGCSLANGSVLLGTLVRARSALSRPYSCEPLASMADGAAGGRATRHTSVKALRARRLGWPSSPKMSCGRVPSAMPRSELVGMGGCHRNRQPAFARQAKSHSHGDMLAQNVTKMCPEDA
jgi:hypothetical protein